jgi:hypothetical protein
MSQRTSSRTKGVKQLAVHVVGGLRRQRIHRRLGAAERGLGIVEEAHPPGDPERALLDAAASQARMVLEIPGAEELGGGEGREHELGVEAEQVESPRPFGRVERPEPTM